jgi:hypothetical protein
MLRVAWLMLGVCLCLTACSHTAAVRQEAPPQQPLAAQTMTVPQPEPRPQTPVADLVPRKESRPTPSPPKESGPAYTQTSYSSKDKDSPSPPPALPPAPRQADVPASKPVAPAQVASAPVEDIPALVALRAYLNGRPAEALAAIKGYDKTSQELLILLLPLLARASEGGLQSARPAEYSIAVLQLQRLADRLRPRAELKIEKMCFCADFGAYGRYRPLPGESPRFESGERVKLYVELNNFTSEFDGNMYRISHKSMLTFLDFDGKPVTFTDPRGRKVAALSIDDERPDLSRSVRHDFAYHYAFNLPALPTNYYTLVLRVTDVPTGRSAERTLDFQVHQPVGP